MKETKSNSQKEVNHICGLVKYPIELHDLIHKKTLKKLSEH